MSKLRFIFLYLFTSIKRYKFIALLPPVLILVIFFASRFFVTLVLKESVSQGLVGTFTETDLPAVVTTLLSKPLFSLDKSGSPSGELIKDIISNDEATVYTLKLKDNLTWSDGSPLRAQDIILSVPDATISTPDDKTIHFKLSDSYSPFLTLLTKPVLKKGSNLGIGPYKVVKTSKDIVFIKKLTLEPVSDPALPNLTIQFFPNEKIAKDALKLGSIQAILGINETDDLKNEKPFKLLEKQNYSTLVTIFYNTQDPILSDENLRLALSYFSPSLPGEVEAKTSIAPSSWAFNDQVKDYLDNPEAGQASLDKVKNLGSGPITLTVTSSLKSTGEKVIEGWNKGGVKSVLRVESGVPQNFQALLISQKIPADPDQYSLWHKLGQTNISKYSNPRLDKDLEDGRKLKNMDARKLKYQDFQKILLDRAPATFLYFSKYNILYLAKIEKALKDVLKVQLSWD